MKTRMKRISRFFPRSRPSQQGGFLAEHKETLLWRVEGKEAPRLLHSLTTNDFIGFIKNKNQHAQSTLFLGSTGEVIAPAIFFKFPNFKQESDNPSDASVFVQVSRELSENLKSHIFDHSFEADIKIYDCTSEFDQSTFFVN